MKMKSLKNFPIYFIEKHGCIESLNLSKNQGCFIISLAGKTTPSQMEKSFNYRKLLQYFLQGLLILAPVFVTIYAIYFVVSSIDSLIPIFTYVDEGGQVRVQNYGLGFVIIIVLILATGYFSSFFITGRIVSFMDKFFQKTPGLKHIYSTTRDFFEAFAGEKKRFTANVLANVDDNDVWRVGFITNEDMADFGLKDYVAVYIPMSYSVAGNVYVIPRNRVKPITNISSAQSMKFAVSGGVSTVEEIVSTHEQGK